MLRGTRFVPHDEILNHPAARVPTCRTGVSMMRVPCMYILVMLQIEEDVV